MSQSEEIAWQRFEKNCLVNIIVLARRPGSKQWKNQSQLSESDINQFNQNINDNQFNSYNHALSNYITKTLRTKPVNYEPNIVALLPKVRIFGKYYPTIF